MPLARKVLCAAYGAIASLNARLDHLDRRGLIDIWQSKSPSAKPSQAGSANLASRRDSATSSCMTSTPRLGGSSANSV